MQTTRSEMLAHPQVQGLISEAVTWPGYPLKRHNDAKHPLYRFSTVAYFGVRPSDPGMEAGIDSVLAHQSPQGVFQTQIRLYKRFGGLDGEQWTWMACDTLTLLYVLLSMGVGQDLRVKHAVNHLVSLLDDNGWRCSAAPELGKFKGPGRRDDPCPIANVYALKALSKVPELSDTPVARTGAEMLLGHWEHQSKRKIYLFGIGTDFRKLKYPFVWYNILHVVDVLSCFPFAHNDPRFLEMVQTITAQADGEGRYTATPLHRCIGPGRAGRSRIKRTRRRGSLSWYNGCRAGSEIQSREPLLTSS